MDLDHEQELVFTGSGEGEMKAWRIDHAALAQGLRETESGEVRCVYIGAFARLNSGDTGLEVYPPRNCAPSRIHA